MCVSSQGKRFLVFLFSWNINFIWVLHGTIKNQLEFYSKYDPSFILVDAISVTQDQVSPFRTMTAHIAEVYFRAWKKATGEVQEQIESSCIQDFMQNAIFLRRTSPVHAKVRQVDVPPSVSFMSVFTPSTSSILWQVVSYFHSRKGVPKVDQMLCRLYKPILWKALSVSASLLFRHLCLIKLSGLTSPFGVRRFRILRCAPTPRWFSLKPSRCTTQTRTTRARTRPSRLSWTLLWRGRSLLFGF